MQYQQVTTDTTTVVTTAAEHSVQLKYYTNQSSVIMTLQYITSQRETQLLVNSYSHKQGRQNENKIIKITISQDGYIYQIVSTHQLIH